MAFNRGRKAISVDVSAAMRTCKKLHDDLSPKMFGECMERTIRDAGNRAVKKIVKSETTKEYAVTAGWVGDKIQRAKFQGSGMSMTCVVPISSARGTLGGIFSAGGGGLAKGRAKKGKLAKKLKHKNGKISATILRGKTSILPPELDHQGGNPPFRLPNGAVMTRKTNQPRPIARVVGRAVPQMVDRHFEDRIEGPLNDYIEKRMEQVIKWKMGI